MLPEARGYRLNLAMANQHLSQLSRETVDALASNARTRVVFQCGQQDARYLAKEFSPVLDEEQLRNLQRFQVAVRLYSDGRTGRIFTGTTRPMPAPLGPEYATGLREAALVRSGRQRELVEEEIQRRFRDTGMTPPALPPDVDKEERFGRFRWCRSQRSRRSAGCCVCCVRARMRNPFTPGSWLPSAAFGWTGGCPGSIRTPRSLNQHPKAPRPQRTAGHREDGAPARVSAPL